MYLGVSMGSYTHVCKNRRALVITSILPADVIAVQQIGTFGGFIVAEEQESLRDAVPKRRIEFTAGRTCAREALHLLGVPASPLLRGEAREPLWPSGVVGSITHCEDYCAAAVAYKDKFLGIGIDAEINEPLPQGILELISHQEERNQLGGLPISHLNWDRLLFSIKESVYKVWYPLAKRWLGFEEAFVTIDPDANAFQVKIVRNSADASVDSLFSPQLRGRYLMKTKHIVTTIVLPND
jgi:4'-phosphopantetheinyl transferase EntD